MAGKFDYGRMQTTASRLMARFAQGEVKLIRAGAQTSAANDWDEPTIADPTIWTLDATVKGVSKRYINNDTILASDLEVTAGVFADEPQPGDVLTIDGVAQTLIETKRIPDAGVCVAWKFFVRG